MSSLADTVAVDSALHRDAVVSVRPMGDLNVNSDPIAAPRHVSLFDLDYVLANGRRAFYDSDVWFGQQTPRLHLRGSQVGYPHGFAKQGQGDDDDLGGASTLVASKVSEAFSNVRPIESFAPVADPPTPEPATLALFGSGLCGIAVTMRRKFRRHD